MLTIERIRTQTRAVGLTRLGFR